MSSTPPVIVGTRCYEFKRCINPMGLEREVKEIRPDGLHIKFIGHDRIPSYSIDVDDMFSDGSEEIRRVDNSTDAADERSRMLSRATDVLWSYVNPIVSRTSSRLYLMFAGYQDTRVDASLIEYIRVTPEDNTVDSKHNTDNLLCTWTCQYAVSDPSPSLVCYSFNKAGRSFQCTFTGTKPMSSLTVVPTDAVH